MHLLRIKTSDELNNSRLKGQVFENLVVAEYQKRDQHLYKHREYHFWQDSHGHEVDLLTRENEAFSLFEIKATQTISSDLFREMDRFEALASPVTVNKTLIYGGLENEKRSRYKVLSWRNISD
jgi:predicted AAA+ superfamily ATPase